MDIHYIVYINEESYATLVLRLTIPYTAGPAMIATAPPIKPNTSLPNRATRAIATGALTT